MKKLTIVSILFFCIINILLINSCKKEKEAEGIDKEMFDMAVLTSGFTWYKNSDNFLAKSTGSGHPETFLRTRFNTIASQNLDSLGKVIEGSTFAEGSMIVKELHNGENNLNRYAILYKKSGNPNADAKGWVWGYINTNATVAEPAANKGSACISCHLQQGNIDYMLMNLYFP
jgi:hypothetical protein